MSSTEVIATIEAILELLRECGGNLQKAEWLSEQKANLESPFASSDAEQLVLDAIHERIPGMNGLVDQFLRPPPSSDYDVESANAELERLATLLLYLTSKRRSE